jgi:hypothetical protein
MELFKGINARSASAMMLQLPTLRKLALRLHSIMWRAFSDAVPATR